MTSKASFCAIDIFPFVKRNMFIGVLGELSHNYVDDVARQFVIRMSTMNRYYLD